MSRPFTPAWLAGDADAVAFLPRAFTDAAARKEAVHAACERPIEPGVLAVLAAQEARRAWTASRARSLERLGHGAAAVVTGQQVGLFLGPLYALHKAATAVVTARALSEESGRPVVPIFWLQTEDHDFAEVASVTLPTQAGLGVHAVADELGEAGARVSLSERRLGPSVAVALESLGLEGPHADEVTALLRRHYRPEATFGAAFGATLAELFAEHGLLVLDPRGAVGGDEVARLAAPVHAFSVARAEAIEAALAGRAEALLAAGFAVQVPVRRGAALTCYAADAAAARYRLERQPDGAFATREATLDHAALETTLARTPERFTTTALLRPLLQDALLPTAAYVGGPGELAYFAELPPLYELAGRRLPLAIPRARFTLVSATARRLAEQLGVGLDDAALPRLELAARLAAQRADLAAIEAQRRALEDALARGLAALAAEAERHGDAGFAKHARKTEEQMRGALERLVDRSRRLALEHDRVTAERIARFQALLAPRGEPQERVLGFASFAAQVGVRALVDKLVASVVPFDGTLRTIAL